MAVTGGAVVAIGAVAAWAWIGTHPAVGTGSFGGPGDGISVSFVAGTPRLAMTGDRAQLVESVRNDGRAPVTLTGATGQLPPGYTVTAQFQPDPFTGPYAVGDTNRPTADTVTLGAGDEAGVLLTVTAPPCGRRPIGAMSLSGVQLGVRSVGITTDEWVDFGSSPLVIPGSDGSGGCLPADATASVS